MGAIDEPLCELREHVGQQQAPLACAIQISYLIPLSTSTLILSRLKTMLYVVHHMPIPDYRIYGEEMLVALQEVM